MTKESTKASYDRGPSNEASTKHRLRLVLALRVKRIDAKPRSGGAGCICRRAKNLEWRERPYVAVSCSEGNEHAPPHMVTKAKMRRDIWASGRFRGVDPRPLSGSETSDPFPHLPLPKSGQMSPPLEVRSSIKIAFGAGLARNRLGIQ